MFRIGICEDDAFFSSQLEGIIKKKFLQYDIDCTVDSFNSGEDLLDRIEKSSKRITVDKHEQ